MDDLHLDGNGVAGLLAEIFGTDVTTADRTCLSCGSRHVLAAHRAYRGAGLVLRCPSCADVAVRIGMLADRYVVEVRGRLLMEVPHGR
jgi:ribosomal protein S27AE